MHAERRSSYSWLSRTAQETLARELAKSPAAQAEGARLFRLLCAYAALDPETGYCQGWADPSLDTPRPSSMPLAPVTQPTLVAMMRHLLTCVHALGALKGAQ